MNTNCKEQPQESKPFTVAPLKDLTATGNVNAEGKIQESGHDLLPQGSIIMWSGNFANVPAGWALCNGANGTPNLQGRFIVAADASTDFQPNNSGGSSINLPTMSVTTDVQGAHSHGFPTNWYNNKCKPSDEVTVIDRGDQLVEQAQTQPSGAHSHNVSVPINYNTGVKTDDRIRPRYYALAFIMKL